jgi:hypothetical protein
MDNCWLLPDGVCLDDAPSGYYGFLYEITDDIGRSYWGKKAFFHKQKKKITKKVIKETKTRKRIERVQKDSEWKSYWGSCKPLLEYIKERGGTHGFTRRIVMFCENRQSLAYREEELLIKKGILFRDDCWNTNVAGRYFKGKIT